MITPSEFNALDTDQQREVMASLPLSEQYLLNMRLVWATEPWKDCPGEWSWAVVMQGYERIREIEAVHE